MGKTSDAACLKELQDKSLYTGTSRFWIMLDCELVYSQVASHNHSGC